MPQAINPDLVAAYSLCQRKAFLLLRGDAGAPRHDYLQILDEHAARSLTGFLDSLTAAGLARRQTNERQNGTPHFIVGETARSDDLEATADVLVSIQGGKSRKNPAYEPHLAIGTHATSKEDKLRLAFVGHVLAGAHRSSPTTGTLVNAAGTTIQVRLPKLIADLAPIITALRAWITAPPQPPPVILNDHCPLCPFRSSCLDQAEKDDSLTLLDRMTPKIMRTYQKKGIFTVNQLSYVFKPRRRSKRQRYRPGGFNLELQAMALRTGKIYLHHTPSVAPHPTELFLDMEGIPDHGSHYLIGLIVATEGSVERHSFWADSHEDEQRIFEEFLSLATQYPEAPIYHYGTYEPKAFERITKRCALAFDSIRQRLVNANTLVFGKVYFPTRSNTLKDVARHLGATWTSPDASGLQSIVWRLRWQASNDPALKDRLLKYNLDDCHALQVLVNELRNIQRLAITRMDVDFVNAPKKTASPLGQQIHESLEGILHSAHEDYKRNRIGIRRSRSGASDERKNQDARKRHPRYHRIVPAKAGKVIRVRRPTKCPRWKAHRNSVLEPTDKVREHAVIDLAFTKNGCRKTVTKYIGTMGYCPKCRLDYSPPAIRRFNGVVFGHSFRAWTVYQRIILRLPYRVIVQVLYDLFQVQVSISGVITFISSLAEYYGVTQDTLLASLLDGPFIHVDETQLNIQGVNHYVWVLTDGAHVVFHLTETREATFIQELLKDYTGVVVSDFYGGYDSCGSRQQKCLVHLIRDLNDDLWKNPFNTELELFVAAFKEVLVPMMADVDRYGLKRRHLAKHTQAVNRFYKKAIDGHDYKCDVVQTYQKRFIRYRESLFRFLVEDGIPWNNNMAERASRHLAVQRKISGSFFKKVAEHYLLLLGIAQKCRFQGKSFLGFLLSKKKDIDDFKEKKRPKVTTPVGGSHGGDGESSAAEVE